MGERSPFGQGDATGPALCTDLACDGRLGTDVAQLPFRAIVAAVWQERPMTGFFDTQMARMVSTVLGTRGERGAERTPCITSEVPGQKRPRTPRQGISRS